MTKEQIEQATAALVAVLKQHQACLVSVFRLIEELRPMFSLTREQVSSLLADSGEADMVSLWIRDFGCVYYCAKDTGLEMEKAFKYKVGTHGPKRMEWEWVSHRLETQKPESETESPYENAGITAEMASLNSAELAKLMTQDASRAAFDFFSEALNHIDLSEMPNIDKKEQASLLAAGEAVAANIGWRYVWNGDHTSLQILDGQGQCLGAFTCDPGASRDCWRMSVGACNIGRPPRRGSIVNDQNLLTPAAMAG